VKLKLSEWAQVAEIVSAVAVLITLAFLVIGINNNTKATQSVVYKDLLASMNDFNRELVKDAELAVLWSRRYSASLASMDKGDAERLVHMNRILYRIFDAAFFAFENHSLDAQQWQRFHDIACVSHANANAAELWTETVAAMSVRFAAYLDENCTD
jgi:hypothetical protein